MHEAERAFLKACFARQDRKAYNNARENLPRQVAYERSIANKQICYWCDKWTQKGWYSWGVSIDSGWFTPEGVEALKAMGL